MCETIEWMLNIQKHTKTIVENTNKKCQYLSANKYDKVLDRVVQRNGTAQQV